MKAVYLEKPWEISIADIEQRPLREGEALLKIRAAGICGVSRNQWTGELSPDYWS